MSKDNVVTADPEDIAQTIFSKEPFGKLTYQIIPNTGEQMDLYEAYRVLITILFEGMDIYTDGLNTILSDDIEEDHILSMNPWFNDLGVNILCDSIDKAKHEEYDAYYCKIVINEESYKFLFEKNNIEKNYHFMINSNYVHTQPNINDISDIYSILISGDKVHQIRFELYQHQT